MDLTAAELEPHRLSTINLVRGSTESVFMKVMLKYGKPIAHSWHASYIPTSSTIIIDTVYFTDPMLLLIWQREGLAINEIAARNDALLINLLGDVGWESERVS